MKFYAAIDKNPPYCLFPLDLLSSSKLAYPFIVLQPRRSPLHLISQSVRAKNVEPKGKAKVIQVQIGDHMPDNCSSLCLVRASNRCSHRREHSQETSSHTRIYVTNMRGFVSAVCHNSQYSFHRIVWQYCKVLHTAQVEGGRGLRYPFILAERERQR